MRTSTFVVLGPVEVRRAGATLPALPPRQRALLAALLVDAGRTVSVDTLVERVWEDRPPAAAGVTVQAAVSKLRRALEPDAQEGSWSLLLTRAPGYRLAVEPDDVDALRFAGLLRTARERAERGELAPAREAVGEALALWHGSAYADVPAEFAVAEAARLGELRLGALELSASLDLRLGRHAELVDHLCALVREEPLREGLRASLLLALYRCGRQAEALQVYAEGRALLADELGVDPSPELQQLYAQVLRQDPVLALPAPRVTLDLDASRVTLDLDASAPAGPAPTAPAPTALAPSALAAEPSAAGPSAALAAGPSAAPAAPDSAAGPPPAEPVVPSPRPGPPPRRRALPAPLTSFVGREEELALLGEALATRRLVTLVGPGGSGKTRAALEAARRHAGPDRPAVLVELVGVEDPGLVADQVASALDVSLAGGDALAALTTSLQDRPLLLVLDNCEHVLDAAAETAAALLPACPDLTVLATSRAPLAVPGEAVLPCGPMGTQGGDSDAVRLFLDRARLAAPHLARPSEDDLALVARVCTALDGLPLALELAAACLTTLPLSEVAARVDDRFALLAGGWRSAPPHQRTLAATVRWSVDLLAPDQHAVFLACSVFAASFAADAVEAVAAPDVSRQTAVEQLRAVAGHSLVELDHARGRFRMLETLRQYADGTLDDARRRELRDRHARFFVHLAEHLEPSLRRRDGAPSWLRLDEEQSNLRAALGHLLETGQPVLALRLCGALGWWWYRRGHVAEGRQWLAAALDAAPDAPPFVRARALLGDALLAYLAGDVGALWARTSEVVARAHVHPDSQDVTLALALVLRGFVAALLGAPEGAEEAARDTARGQAIAEASGIEWVQAEIAMTLGQAARAAGDPDAAMEHLARAERLSLHHGHTWAWSSVQWVRAKVLVDLGQGDAALQALSSMVGLTLPEGDTTGTLAGLLTAVGAATAAGHPQRAAVLLGAVRALSRRVGYDPLRMDPFDGQRYVAQTQAALGDGPLEAAALEGALLDLAGACALVHDLADRSALSGRASAG